MSLPKKISLPLSGVLSTEFISTRRDSLYAHRKNNGWILVGELELVPFELLWREGVALVPGQVQHLRAGLFVDADEQHSGVSFFLGQRKTFD